MNAFRSFHCVGDILVQRIIDQHGEKKGFSLAPIGDLQAFLTLVKLDVFFFNRRRLRVFLAYRGDCGGNRFGSSNSRSRETRDR